MIDLDPLTASLKDDISQNKLSYLHEMLNQTTTQITNDVHGLFLNQNGYILILMVKVHVYVDQITLP